MNYFGTFRTVTLKYVKQAYIIRGPFPLAKLIIICKPTCEARGYGHAFKFPKKLLAKQSRSQA